MRSLNKEEATMAMDALRKTTGMEISQETYKVIYISFQRIPLDSLQNFFGYVRACIKNLTKNNAARRRIEEQMLREYTLRIRSLYTKERIPSALKDEPKKYKAVPIAVRYTILRRDKYRCRICGVSAEDSSDVRLHVDHITPRIKGGTNDPINLWVLCQECNLGKGTQDL